MRFRGLRIVFLVAAGIAVGGSCRCERSPPGDVGRAGGALEAIPGDVDAVVVIDAEGMRQGSLGDLVYRPLIERAFREWGGARCERLPAERVRAAALGIRLPRGDRPSRQFFLSAEGPSLDDARACLDDHGAREGLSSSFEEIGGGRGITDQRGFHILASGPQVVTLSFPFGRKEVLAEAAPVGLGRTPSVAQNASFAEILSRVEGDLTVALSETRDLFREYGEDLRDGLVSMVPADACATVDELRGILQAARFMGFGDLPGLVRVLDAWFPGLENVCAADAVRVVFDAAAKLRSAAVGVTGRDDIIISLVLVFTEDGVAADFRGLFTDIVQIVGDLPTKLDVLERLPWVSDHVDLTQARDIARDPILKHLEVRGDGPVFEFRLRVEAADARAAVETVQGLANSLASR